MALPFNGPLFIVGLPRSGTKLIRDLLNQNPHIGIPVSETHFIPYWIGKFGQKPNFNETGRYDAFFKEFCQTPFYENMARQGLWIESQTLIEMSDLNNWASILEAILRFYAPKEGMDFIWGDKTPGYVTHIRLLNSFFEEPRFLHIIRDPRDYALSVNNAWGKQLYLAADVWQQTILKARKSAAFLGERYMEIFYENLLADPENVLKAVCAFLDCDFVPEMLVLERPSENLGDAKGRTDIMQDNTGKYHERLEKAKIRRIEEIVWPVMGKAMPYKVHYGQKHRPLSLFTRQTLHLFDGWASALFHMREKGMRRGLSYFYRLHVRSSWR
ncbi:hypothetical protein GWN26_00525 [Candidatus Saccharibacteria bacterium]|nr:hypothetical protein [Candidatus Saccharibacteria bacterium]